MAQQKKGRDRRAGARQPDEVSRRAMLKSSFSTAVVGLFFGAACGDDKSDPGPDGVYPLSGRPSGSGTGSGSGGGSSSSGALCTNTCEYANDGDCDDGGPSSDTSLCDYGTDCGDCGTRYGSGSDYSDSYSDYSDSYSNSYSDYSDSYSDYSDSYYNYSDYVYYYNYFSNSW
jgi:hypothetical protein